MLSRVFKSKNISNFVCNSTVPGIEVCHFSIPYHKEKISVDFNEIVSEHSFEIFFCYKGNLLINKTDKQTISIQKNEAILISNIHCINNIDINDEIEGVLVSVNPLKAEESLFAICRIIGNWDLNIDIILKYINKVGNCVVIKNNSWLFSVFSSLENLDNREQDCYCIWKSIELLYMLSSQIIQPKYLGGLKNSRQMSERINDICFYIELHLDEKITIEMLCQKFHLSSTSLKREFKNIYGQPIHSWILEKRMKKASELLKFSSMTILQVAQSVGYSGLSQFNVAFKKYYDCTPLKYKKMSKNVNFGLI